MDTMLGNSSTNLQLTSTFRKESNVAKAQPLKVEDSDYQLVTGQKQLFKHNAIICVTGYLLKSFCTITIAKHVQIYLLSFVKHHVNLFCRAFDP